MDNKVIDPLVGLLNKQFQTRDQEDLTVPCPHTILLLSFNPNQMWQWFQRKVVPSISGAKRQDSHKY